MLKVALKLQEKYNRASLIGRYIQKTNLSITGFSAIQGLMQEKIDFSQIRATIIDESFFLPNFKLLPNSNYSNAIDSNKHIKMSNKYYHGDSTLQSFIQPFKHISLEKTKLIPVTAIHNSQIRDTNLCQETAPSLHPQGVMNCSFSFSYAAFESEGNKSRIKENYKIITKQSDQLLIQADGNNTKTLDQDIQCNHDALFNHYVGNQDLLESTIFVGNFNIISHSIDKSSNLAGSYDQHYILAPGAVQSHCLPGTLFYTAFENGGTSCAAPLVTAGASMLRACFPWADSKTIKNAIISTGNKDIQGYAPELHGAGLLNMQGAFYYLQHLENPELELASRL